MDINIVQLKICRTSCLDWRKKDRLTPQSGRPQSCPANGFLWQSILESWVPDLSTSFPWCQKSPPSTVCWEVLPSQIQIISLFLLLVISLSLVINMTMSAMVLICDRIAKIIKINLLFAEPVGRGVSVTNMEKINVFAFLDELDHLEAIKKY